MSNDTHHVYHIYFSVKTAYLAASFVHISSTFYTVCDIFSLKVQNLWWALEHISSSSHISLTFAFLKVKKLPRRAFNSKLILVLNSPIIGLTPHPTCLYNASLVQMRRVLVNMGGGKYIVRYYVPLNLRKWDLWQPNLGEISDARTPGTESLVTPLIV